MKKLLTIALILCTLTASAQMRGGSQFDPGAARSNLSNVDATATPSMTSITLSDKIRAAWADILGDIYASGTAKVATGTAAAPAYSFGSDPDTGIYSPGADTIGFSSGGVDKLRLTSDNDFGIGTTTPKMAVSGDARELHLVAGSGQVAGVRIETIDGQNAEFFVPPGGVNAWGLYSTSNIPFLLYTNSAERMSITAGGNVLIATSTDDGANKLQVNGPTKIKMTTDDRAVLICEEPDNDSRFTISHITDDVFRLATTYDTTGSFQPMAFFTSDTERMRITSAGNVLIATSTAETGQGNSLEVACSSYRGVFLKSTGSNTRPTLSFANTLAAKLSYIQDTSDGGLAFGSANSDFGGHTEAARITNSGNVLIATSTDDGANKLQVNGSMRLIGMATPTATEGGIYFNSTDKHFYGYNGTAWVQLDN